jgi:hypothetical protein
MMAHQAESLEKKGETKKTRGFQMRLLAIPLFIIAGCAATCGPASAQVYWAIARRAAGAIIDDQGRYAAQGPDFEGQTRRLRAADGVHFTKAGAVKLASYVDRDLRRVISSQVVVPVGLPSAETVPTAGARPDVGPVLPLSIGGGERGDLLGAESHPAQTTPDPIAAKVLSRGAALAAPAGRADNFSWPRSGSDASATSEVSPQPVKEGREGETHHRFAREQNTAHAERGP